MLESNAEQREAKLASLIKKVYDKKNGNRMRQVVRIVAKAYEQNPEQLKEYFSHARDKLAGIATSAYHLLTGDIMPIQEIEYGGLGAIIEESEEGLEFRKCQLQFAKLSMHVLSFSRNSGQALQYSENSEWTLHYSTNSEQALQYSENSDWTLHYSTNSGQALQYSKNSSHTLQHSTNSGQALQYSKNSIFALNLSTNSGQALQYSKNSDHIPLKFSINSGQALKYSKNSGRALGYSKNSGEALQYSRNSDQTLRYSENSDEALKFSANSDEALQYPDDEKSIEMAKHDKEMAKHEREMAKHEKQKRIKHAKKIAEYKKESEIRLKEKREESQKVYNSKNSSAVPEFSKLPSETAQHLEDSHNQKMIIEATQKKMEDVEACLSKITKDYEYKSLELEKMLADEKDEQCKAKIESELEIVMKEHEKEIDILEAELMSLKKEMNNAYATMKSSYDIFKPVETTKPAQEKTEKKKQPAQLLEEITYFEEERLIYLPEKHDQEIKCLIKQRDTEKDEKKRQDIESQIKNIEKEYKKECAELEVKITSLKKEMEDNADKTTDFKKTSTAESEKENKLIASKKDLERRLEEKIKKYKDTDLLANEPGEEYVYINLQECECGGMYESVMQVLDMRDKVAYDVQHAACKKCGQKKIFEFGIITYYYPELFTEMTGSEIFDIKQYIDSMSCKEELSTAKLKIQAFQEFLKDLQERPSRIIDVYQWICLAKSTAKINAEIKKEKFLHFIEKIHDKKDAPRTRHLAEAVIKNYDQDVILKDNKKALHYVQDALRFYQPDQAYPPAESFFNTQINEQIMAETNKQKVLAFKENIEEVIKLLEKGR